MTSREAERDRHGENFCQIEFDNFYHPIWSGELVQLAKEVWSIMDADQRLEFLRDEVFPNYSERHVMPIEAVPGQRIPPGGAPVEWQE